MKTKIIDSAALRAISPTSLRSFATFEGWKRVRPYGEDGEVYAIEGLPEIILPVTEVVADYDYVVSRALEMFSRQKERDELSIYRDLVHADSDVIRVRAFDADDDGSVQIESGVGIISSARDAIAAAACSAREPRRSFHVGKIQQTQEYLSKVRLG